MSSSSMITPILLLRANIDFISCFIAILINLSFIYKILHRKTRNFLLINSSLNLICSCLTLLLSNILTLYYSISSQLNLPLCRLNGYLINSFFHGIIYSYVLLSINLFTSKNYQSSTCLIMIQIVCQWFLAFSISYVLNQYDFQAKGRLCFTRKRFSLILNFLNSLILPISFILLFNLIVYLYVHKLRTNDYHTYQQTSHRLYRRQHEKHIKHGRQTISFFCLFFFGWGIFILLSFFDRYEIIPDDIYLIILSFPSISLLIITLLIKSWNKPGKKSLFTSKNPRTLSTTTIRFSQSINMNNHIDLI